ncbi:hypothetical protein [Porphyromonas sp. COT-052 OH4946]|uniref:hypothetical protein n=1 Tax=Porphyromonas sp. COT-052 OH4946 TaxID=1515618 RepID=UPI0013784CDB|nr:hypothetical protein [Porphyromonas sp. COT-052 OH4946]
MERFNEVERERKPTPVKPRTQRPSSRKQQPTSGQPDLFSGLWDTPALTEQFRQPPAPPSFDTAPRPYLSVIGEHLRDGSIVRQGKQIGYLSQVSEGNPLFHPVDLPSAQIGRLALYIDLRDTYRPTSTRSKLRRRIRKYLILMRSKASSKPTTESI